MDKRIVGGLYEQRAMNYLLKNGFCIIDTNYRCRLGEIDIIAIKDEILRFIEVKYRKNNSFGEPYEAVTKSKQRKIIKTAMWYLNVNAKYQNRQCSFDVISITDSEIMYLENCFGEI